MKRHRIRGLSIAAGLAGSLIVSSASAEQADDDVEVVAKPTPAPSPSSVPAPAPAETRKPSREDELEARLRTLEAKLAEAPPPPAPAKAPDATSVRAEREPSLTTGLTGPLGLVFSGYVQGQYETNQASEDQIQQGGVLLNQDRFSIRRARLRVDRAWTWASTTIEVDGNTVRGPSFGLRRAEVSLLWRNPEPGAPPWVRLTGGLSEIPFGYELTDSARNRYFMERSTGSLALFPGEPDVGVRLSGGVSFFRYALAALNGEPIDDRPGRYAGDPTAAKDLVGRVGIETRPRDDLRVTGGVSFLTGKGFHRGTEATKNSVVWRDLNENGSVDGGEITAVPGTAATPSQTFNRWAFGADLGFTLDTPIGKTRLYGEVFVAQNADRGLVAADPIATGSDVREIGFYGAFVQEISRYGVVGFRLDRYDPNADFLDKRAGKLIPASQAIQTYSPMVGVLLPDRVRFLVQYDAIVDSLARDGQGVPTDLKNNRLTFRLQGEL